MVVAMDCFLTPREEITLDLIFGLLGEPSRIIYKDDAPGTADKYAAIAARAPKLAVLHENINFILHNMAAAGRVPFEICSFKKGDRYYRYDKISTSLSLETIRKAWVKSGMRELQLQHKRLKAKSKRSH